VTSYNIGACLRAMGRFVQARVHLDRADALDAAAGAAQLSEAMREKAAQFREDIDASMVQLSIAVKPNEVMLAIDGRPLARDGGSETAPRYLAGIREPGPAEKVAAERFEVLIDPGVHVIRLSRRGYRSRIHNQSMAPGKRVRVTLALERLPATLIVDADRDAALVTIDGKDAGFAPVRLARPGGSYRVLVEKEGYVPYATTARVDPGEVWRVRAKLPDEEPALYERWWFWTAAGAVVTGAVIGTYFATRPEPQKPPPDGGGFGWYVEVP
jgi:hypothetical protein